MFLLVQIACVMTNILLVQIAKLYHSKQCRSWYMLCFPVSDLGLHCLPYIVPLFWDARHLEASKHI